MSTNPFPIAAGHGNFPNGVFSPDLFAKEALYYFRQLSVVDEITNNQYEGMIQNQGDTVHIRKQPQISIKAYKRGTTLETQNIVDEETTLVIDKGNYFQFAIDTVMDTQSDVDYEELASESAAYELRDAYDLEVLDYIFDNVDSNNVEGSSGSEKTIGYGSGNDYRPLDAISRLNRILSEDNVPNTGRWLAASPEFFEALSREVGKLVEVQVTGDSKSLIRDKGVLDMPIHGFTMFQTNNAPTNASGNPILLAGHVSSTATATQLIENQVLPNPNDFGYIYRGLHVYGRKVLRPKALAAMHMSIGDA